MTLADIARYRLNGQQIAETKFTKPKDIVSWLGAVQAQDYSMAKWAIALRLKNADNNTIEEAINKGEIIRLHILRPTWHFVAADDIYWMLQLTAPQIRKAASFMYKKLELDEKVFKKTQSIITGVLEGGKQLTRQELMTELNKAGIVTDALRGTHILFQAELDGIVCNGSLRNRQFTYSLLREKVPPPAKTFSRNEALAALAKRYFCSHGPATEQDFAWWSDLNLTDARLGLESVKANLLSETVEGKKYWFGGEESMKKQLGAGIHLLPAYDEFMVSYKDRTASLPAPFTKETITGNGIFNPIIVLNGQVVGLWKRTINKTNAEITFQFFDKRPLNARKVRLAAKKYETFLKTPIRIT